MVDNWTVVLLLSSWSYFGWESQSKGARHSAVAHSVVAEHSSGSDVTRRALSLETQGPGEQRTVTIIMPMNIMENGFISHSQQPSIGFYNHHQVNVQLYLDTFWVLILYIVWLRDNMPICPFFCFQIHHNNAACFWWDHDEFWVLSSKRNPWRVEFFICALLLEFEF